MSQDKKFENFVFLQTVNKKGRICCNKKILIRVTFGFFISVSWAIESGFFSKENKTYLSSMSLSRFSMSDKLKGAFFFTAFRPRLNKERFSRILASSADTRLGFGFATRPSGARVSYLADMWVAIAQYRQWIILSIANSLLASSLFYSTASDSAL